MKLLRNIIGIISILAIPTIAFAVYANRIETQTSSFDGILSPSNTTVQSALNTLDDFAESDPLWRSESGAYIKSETDPIFLAQSGSFVPYSGATRDVDLGFHNLSGSIIEGSAFNYGDYSLGPEFQYLDGISSQVYRVGGPVKPSVSDNGTGRSSHTAYALIAGGTTPTNPQQSISNSLIAGTILRSNGTSVLPSWTTATYPSTTTINQVLYSTSANAIGGSANMLFDGNTFTVTSASAGQLKPSYNASIYTNMRVGSDGTMTMTNTGGSAGDFLFVPTATGSTTGLFGGSGIIRLGGENGTYNESLDFKFDVHPNAVELTSATGVNTLSGSTINTTFRNITGSGYFVGSTPGISGTYNVDGSAAGTLSSITITKGIITAVTTR